MYERQNVSATQGTLRAIALLTYILHIIYTTDLTHSVVDIHFPRSKEQGSILARIQFIYAVFELPFIPLVIQKVVLFKCITLVYRFILLDIWNKEIFSYYAFTMAKDLKAYGED